MPRYKSIQAHIVLQSIGKLISIRLVINDEAK